MSSSGTGRNSGVVSVLTGAGTSARMTADTADIDHPGDFVRGRIDRRCDRGPALENEDAEDLGGVGKKLISRRPL